MSTQVGSFFKRSAPVGFSVAAFTRIREEDLTLCNQDPEPDPPPPPGGSHLTSLTNPPAAGVSLQSEASQLLTLSPACRPPGSAEDQCEPRVAGFQWSQCPTSSWFHLVPSAPGGIVPSPWEHETSERVGTFTLVALVAVKVAAGCRRSKTINFVID